MAGSKMFSVAVVLAFGSAAALAPPLASPCDTVPPATCATFTCPSNYVAKVGSIFCGGKDGPNCGKEACCTVVTTLTTTPGTTVTTTPGTTVTTTPGTTVTTTPSPTGPPCSTVAPVVITTVTTTPGTTVTTTPGTTVTTTPGTTVTTTPPPTCGDFACPKDFDNLPKSTVCTGHCDSATCCKQGVPPCATIKFTTVTTTPGPEPTTVTVTPAPEPTTVTTTPAPEPTTVTTTPAPTAAPTPAPTPPPPASPCGTVGPAARKYDAKAAVLAQQATAPKKESNMAPAWAFPLFAAVGMFSFAGFVAVRRGRSTRSTRQVNVVAPDELDEMPFLSDDGPIE